MITACSPDNTSHRQVLGLKQEKLSTDVIVTLPKGEMFIQQSQSIPKARSVSTSEQHVCQHSPIVWHLGEF